jgi:hypothetical protein
MTVTRANNPSFYQKGFKVVKPKPTKELPMKKKGKGCKKGG